MPYSYATLVQKKIARLRLIFRTETCSRMKKSFPLSWISVGLLLLAGAACFLLSILLPQYLESGRIHDGIAISAPGWQSIVEAENYMLVSFSILFSGSVALLALEPRDSKSQILLGVFAIILFSGGTIWTLERLLSRPISASAPTVEDVYLSLRFLLWGLGSTMFSLASRRSSQGQVFRIVLA